VTKLWSKNYRVHGKFSPGQHVLTREADDESSRARRYSKTIRVRIQASLRQRRKTDTRVLFFFALSHQLSCGTSANWRLTSIFRQAQHPNMAKKTSSSGKQSAAQSSKSLAVQLSKPSAVQSLKPSAAPSPIVEKISSMPTIIPKKDENVFEDPESAVMWAQDHGINLDKAMFDGPKGLSPYVFHSIRYKEADFMAVDDVSFETSCLIHVQHLETMEKRLFITPHLPIDPASIAVSPVPDRADDKGLFATDLIEAGTIAISERPTIILPNTISLGSLEKDKNDISRTLFEHLPVVFNDRPGWQVKLLRDLKNAKSPAECLEEGIIRTNSLAITLEQDTDPNYNGVFLKLSRCNHRYGQVLILLLLALD
jgi:hypothetical protein